LSYGRIEVGLYRALIISPSISAFASSRTKCGYLSPS